MLASELTVARKRQALDHALGSAIAEALADPQVVEVLVNPDGRIVVDRLDAGRVDTGVRLPADARERVIRLVADHMGEPVTRETPRLAGVLPSGERFQGMLPPVSPQPAFAIRKRPARIWRLSELVAQGALRPEQAEMLQAAAVARRNILITGGTGSGKTTLANAILAESAFALDRVILIEDVPELQCAAWDLLSLLTRRHPAPIGVAELVRDALRLRPDRIIIGEMRDGMTALETLKAWNTGHPGGISTLHANSATEALSRLDELLAEVTARTPAQLIARAVELVVHMRRTGGRPTAQEVLDLTSKP